MNDYKKLQLIYEGGGMSVAGAGNPRYAPDPLNVSPYSYGKLAFNSPPESSEYNKGANAGTGGPIPIEAEETDIKKDSIVSTELVINKLNEFINEAKKAQTEMSWAFHRFITLKEFILKNTITK